MLKVTFVPEMTTGGPILCTRVHWPPGGAISPVGTLSLSRHAGGMIIGRGVPSTYQTEGEVGFLVQARYSVSAKCHQYQQIQHRHDELPGTSACFIVRGFYPNTHTARTNVPNQQDLE